MELLHVYRESTSVYSFYQAPKAIICVQNLPVQLCFRVSEQLRKLEYLSNPHVSFPHTHHGQTPLVHARNTHTVTTATTNKLIYNLYRMSALSVSPGWLHGVCVPLGHCPQHGLSPSTASPQALPPSSTAFPPPLGTPLLPWGPQLLSASSPTSLFLTSEGSAHLSRTEFHVFPHADFQESCVPQPVPKTRCSALPPHLDLYRSFTCYSL